MKDIYVYKGTNVLINKLDIRNGKELDEKKGIIYNDDFPSKNGGFLLFLL